MDHAKGDMAAIRTHGLETDMETDSSDDSAVDALAFLELADANISPLNDTDAWETTLDHLHEAAEVDSAMLSEVLDEVTIEA